MVVLTTIKITVKITISKVVSEISCAKIHDDAPLDKICLFGCGVRCYFLFPIRLSVSHQMHTQYRVSLTHQLYFASGIDAL